MELLSNWIQYLEKYPCVQKKKKDPAKAEIFICFYMIISVIPIWISVGGALIMVGDLGK